jgi:hypothetical protein
MLFIASVLLLAISRAEMIERFKAPVLTQGDGLVKIYATCAVDVRREYQAPVARFAGETVTALAHAEKRRLSHAESPSIIIHLGDVRTNDASVVSRVTTNDARVVTRLYLPSPAHTNLDALRIEIVRAYARALQNRELSADEARETFLMTSPDYRVIKSREKLATWLDRMEGATDAEGTKLLYRVMRPGTLSRIEARVFASRLRLYPSTFARPFLGSLHELDFRAAIDAAPFDPSVRVAARKKADELPVFGGGRGLDLQVAAEAYRFFLLALAKGEASNDALKDLLEVADLKLNKIYEETK